MTDRDDQGRTDPWATVLAHEDFHGYQNYRAEDVDRARADDQAEIARLTQERDEWKAAHDALERVDLKTRDRLREAEAERDALAAQVAGLREASTQMVAACCAGVCLRCAPVRAALDAARATLRARDAQMDYYLSTATRAEDDAMRAETQRNALLRRLKALEARYRTRAATAEQGGEEQARMAADDVADDLAALRQEMG